MIRCRLRKGTGTSSKWDGEGGFSVGGLSRYLEQPTVIDTDHQSRTMSDVSHTCASVPTLTIITRRMIKIGTRPWGGGDDDDV